MFRVKPRKDVYLPVAGRILEVRALTGDEMFFKVQRGEADTEHFMPGQFFTVGIPGIGEAPISICSSPSRNGDGTFEMVVRKVGNVTDALHRLGEGALVGLRGPFGTTFPVDGEMLNHDVLFVCGGLGIVPVRSAIQYVLDHRDRYGEVTILYGTRRPHDRLFVEELFDWKTREDVTFLETVDMADPSWGGSVGVITTLFPRIQLDAANTIAIVCGPPVMYKFVLRELRKLGMDHRHIYVSLERHMRCAVGKCGRCQINGVYACQTGPVYNYANIEPLREAI